MATRILNLMVSCAYMMVLTLVYRGILLDMAQRASSAGAGVGHVFSLGAGYGMLFASSLFLTVFSAKSLVLYCFKRNRTNNF